MVGLGSAVNSNKEHLIGRNFVPRGSLGAGAFNFIFRACVDCNQRKAEAERHVSTVTLFASPARRDDEELNRTALHKAIRDFHPRLKGTRVIDASTERQYQMRLGNATLTFNMVAPPQLDEERGALLACNQVQGLFAMITSWDPRNRDETRLLPADQWKPLGGYPVQDWGNPQLQTVIQRAAGWPLLAGIVTANGYFKAIIRRRDEPGSEWFWALEWNKSYRVAGAISGKGIPPLLKDLPEQDWKYLSPTSRCREEVPISENDDSLFVW